MSDQGAQPSSRNVAIGWMAFASVITALALAAYLVSAALFPTGRYQFSGERLPILLDTRTGEAWKYEHVTGDIHKWEPIAPFKRVEEKPW